MDSLLDGLNDRQKEAVINSDGPMLVIAGAGSGKTRALTHRVAYMIKEKGVSPWNVLAVTFTNKAAKEMRERVNKLLSSDQEAVFMEAFSDIMGFENMQNTNNSASPAVGTFHSICVRILRKHIHLLDYENTFAIYDAADQQILVKRMMEQLRMDPKRINPKAVLAHISNAKNQLMGPEEFGKYAHDYFSEKVAEVYPLYQTNLRKNNALDFDDIIMKTVELFQKFPDVLAQYQERFKYILVDEYQDTNKAQYLLIKMLAAKYRNLCVIGDEDQSIYSWRGATIQNILDFEKDYPEARVVVLEQNYRSSKTILEAAHSVIKLNAQRKDKKLWTEKEDGAKVRHWLADNERHEGLLIAQEITDLIISEEYPDYRNFVILYRTNAQSRIFEEVFIQHGIPYKIVGGIRFYERKEVKDILAYLRAIQNPDDSISLLRIINNPTRKIGPKTLEAVQDFALRNGLSFFKAMLLANEIGDLSAAKVAQLEDFVKLMKNLQSLNREFSASGMIKHVLSESGYKKMLDDGSVEGESRLENIRELITVAQKYDKLEAGQSLSIFLEEVSLISDLDSMNESDNAVTLMTVHSAKGLEFPHVFIAGLEEGIFPHSRSLLDHGELEEERRLMYVAMTRAMENLYLLHARTRTLYGESRSNLPSQFLAQIDDRFVESNFGRNSKIRMHVPVNEIVNRPVPLEAERGIEVELDVGDKVSHKIFGNGIVVNVQGGVVTVAFEDSSVGVKKLAVSVAPLRKI